MAVVVVELAEYSFPVVRVDAMVCWDTNMTFVLNARAKETSANDVKLANDIVHTSRGTKQYCIATPSLKASLIIVSNVVVLLQARLREARGRNQKCRKYVSVCKISLATEVPRLNIR